MPEPYSVALSMVNMDHDVGIDWPIWMHEHWDLFHDSLFDADPTLREVLVHHHGYFLMDQMSVDSSEKRLCDEIRKRTQSMRLDPANSSIWLNDEFDFYPTCPYHLGRDLITRQLPEALNMLHPKYDGSKLNIVLVMPAEIIASILRYLSLSCSFNETTFNAAPVEKLSHKPETLPPLVHSEVFIDAECRRCAWLKFSLGQHLLRHTAKSK
jgi:hypothetical protein